MLTTEQEIELLLSVLSNVENDEQHALIAYRILELNNKFNLENQGLATGHGSPLEKNTCYKIAEIIQKPEITAASLYFEFSLSRLFVEYLWKALMKTSIQII